MASSVKVFTQSAHTFKRIVTSGAKKLTTPPTAVVKTYTKTL